MYVDAHNLFSDSQAVTATAVSENLIDFGSARDIGVGRELYLLIVVTVVMTDASSDSTVAVTIETDDNEGFSSTARGVTGAADCWPPVAASVGLSALGFAG